MNDNSQNRLTYVTRSFINPKELPSLRGVSSRWIGDTIHLLFFFDKEASEEEKEEVADIATEIIAQFSSGFLEEQFITLHQDENLPDDPFLAYRRNSISN